MATLTGWPLADIRRKAGLTAANTNPAVPAAWWKELWK